LFVPKAREIWDDSEILLRGIYAKHPAETMELHIQFSQTTPTILLALNIYSYEMYMHEVVRMMQINK